jgi:hypothetical protein
MRAPSSTYGTAVGLARSRAQASSEGIVIVTVPFFV